MTWSEERQELAGSGSAARACHGRYLVAQDGANLGGAGVGRGDDLDELGILEPLGLGGSEDGLEIDAPVGAQPHETLQRDNGGTPDECPLRGRDVLVVEFGGVVVTGEDGPYYGERPDVGVEVDGQRG